MGFLCLTGGLISELSCPAPGICCPALLVSFSMFPVTTNWSAQLLIVQVKHSAPGAISGFILPLENSVIVTSAVTERAVGSGRYKMRGACAGDLTTLNMSRIGRRCTDAQGIERGRGGDVLLPSQPLASTLTSRSSPTTAHRSPAKHVCRAKPGFRCLQWCIDTRAPLHGPYAYTTTPHPLAASRRQQCCTRG